MTVGENVGLALRERGEHTETEIRDIVAEKLNLVGLPGIEDKKPADLSGGMRKRVGLARAIAEDPAYILYDEPTTGLDPITAMQINILIRMLQDKLNITSIVVTHDMISADFVGRPAGAAPRRAHHLRRHARGHQTQRQRSGATVHSGRGLRAPDPPRPSLRPARVADVCTYLSDGMAVAALYLCLTGMLQRLRRSNQRWRTYANMLIDENRWRAQRYGADEGLIDFGIGANVAYADLLEELIEMVMPEAETYGCVDELLHGRTILKRGTSADQQRAVHQAALEGGATKDEALKAVVDFLVEATVADL